jgi:hypothetical protein
MMQQTGGALNVKWRELEFSLLPNSALKCVPRNAKGLRRSCGLWRSAENLRAEPFDLWHSVVKFYQGVGIPQYIGKWWLAFRSPLESGLPRSYSCCGNPRHLTAELGKWPNSSTRHFTSTVPLFVTSQIFEARLSRCKTDTRQIV